MIIGRKLPGEEVLLEKTRVPVGKGLKNLTHSLNVRRILFKRINYLILEIIFNMKYGIYIYKGAMSVCVSHFMSHGP